MIFSRTAIGSGFDSRSTQSPYFAIRVQQWRCHELLWHGYQQQNNAFYKVLPTSGWRTPPSFDWRFPEQNNCAWTCCQRWYTQLFKISIDGKIRTSAPITPIRRLPGDSAPLGVINTAVIRGRKEYHLLVKVLHFQSILLRQLIDRDSEEGVRISKWFNSKHSNIPEWEWELCPLWKSHVLLYWTHILFEVCQEGRDFCPPFKRGFFQSRARSWLWKHLQIQQSFWFGCWWFLLFVENRDLD